MDGGGVKVNNFLQVQGLQNVFAVGDCCVTCEEKNALSADLGASLVALNIKRMSGSKQMLPFPQVSLSPTCRFAIRTDSHTERIRANPTRIRKAS